VAVGVASARHPQRLGIQLDDQPIDPRDQFLLRQPVALRCEVSQRRIEARPHLGIGDQRGAVLDGRQHPELDRARKADIGELGEPFEQGQPVAHGRGGPSAADAQLGSDLGGGGLPVIDTPAFARGVELVDALLAESTRRDQPPHGGHPFAALVVAHRRQQLRRTKSFVHMFDYPVQCRPITSRETPPVDESRTVDNSSVTRYTQ
jgi:hypothetical protein